MSPSACNFQKDAKVADESTCKYDDECGVCGGNNTCKDCAGIVNGKTTLDACG